MAVHVIDPALNAWAQNPVSAANAPSTRSGHTAVWASDSLVIWGGWPYPYNGMTSTGGALGPSGYGLWIDTASMGAPSPRWFHTAVSTGSKMIVWGGAGDVGFTSNLNTGGVYDPLSNAWSATSTSGAPSGRSGHVAVWTGSKMIVWGGWGDGGVGLSSGGVFDPATNSWSPTATAGAPSPRGNAVAVWTGSRMLVWGGENDALVALDGGGSYDPATNTWTAISSVGEPSARHLAAGVWTGAKMVVWGGASGSTRFDTGGIYDPHRDSWAAMTAPGAPSPRAQHTAVWNGSQMIVLGGFDAASTSLSTGGIYDDPSLLQ